MNIALIGFGYWGPNLAKNLYALGDLYAICDTDSKKLDKAKASYGDKLKYSSDYKESLADPAVDAMAIATTTEIAYGIAIDSLTAGKHVFIEKPIAKNVESVNEMQKIAVKKNLMIHTDHIMVYNPVISYIKKMIDDGTLGDLMYIEVSRVNLGPIRKDVNAMLDLAVHDIAVIDYLSGGQIPESLVAVGQALYGKQESLTYLTIKYPTFIANIKTSWVSPLKERKTVIAGTKKMVIFDDLLNDKLAVYDHGIEAKTGDIYGEVEYETRVGDILYPHIQMQDSLRNSIIHFKESVESCTPSLSGIEPSLRVTRVLEMAMDSLRSKQHE